LTTKAAYPLKMPGPLKRAAERLAAEDGVPLGQWINVAMAQKIGAVETAERLRRRYVRARPDDLREVLAKVPDAPLYQATSCPRTLGQCSLGTGRAGARGIRCS
jgi:hypothetical protein